MSDNIIVAPTSTMKAPLGQTFSANGKVWMYAVTHGALTAKQPYAITFNEFGCVTAALADNIAVYRIGVPQKAWGSGVLALMQIGGLIDDVITTSLSVSVGHAFIMTSGAIADGGSDYTGLDGEFAVCAEASTTSTTQKMMLVPEKFKATT